MNILVTGASGFIAQHLINSLINENNVFGLSRDSLFKSESLEVIRADLTDQAFEKTLPTNIDCVIHLAQSSAYKNFPDAAEDIYKVNVEATFRLLEWSRKNQVKRFIFTSTANVYSNTPVLLDEESQTIPDSFYAASKLCAEKIIYQYQECFFIDILRLFTVYGPGQKNMLIPTIANRMKAGAEITLGKGIGVNLTPVYVGDVVHIIHALLSSQSEKRLRLLNICGAERVGLNEITQKLELILNVSAFIRITEDEPKSFIGNNLKLRKMFPDITLTKLETGLRKSFSLN